MFEHIISLLFALLEPYVAPRVRFKFRQRHQNQEKTHITCMLTTKNETKIEIQACFGVVHWLAVFSHDI